MDRVVDHCGGWQGIEKSSGRLQPQLLIRFKSYKKIKKKKDKMQKLEQGASKVHVPQDSYYVHSFNILPENIFVHYIFWSPCARGLKLKTSAKMKEIISSLPMTIRTGAEVGISWL